MTTRKHTRLTKSEDKLYVILSNSLDEWERATGEHLTARKEKVLARDILGDNSIDIARDDNMSEPERKKMVSRVYNGTFGTKKSYSQIIKR